MSFRRRRGSVLLAVLWLAAALAAIAFSLANTVRSETQRTGTTSEGLRTYYLATAGIERTLVYMRWGGGQRNPDGSAKYWAPDKPVLMLQFPSGDVRVDVIPESGKLDVNKLPPPELSRLLAAMGIEPQRVQVITNAIVDWRTGAPGGMSVLDHEYLARGPTFRARHASLEEIEELLLVKGMTPELFHGSFTRDAEGRLVQQTGLKHCLSVWGTTGSVDANSAEPAVLATVGLSPTVISALVQRRRAQPFRNSQELSEFAGQWGGPGFSRLVVNPESKMYTLRASARLRLPDGRYSDLLRSVSALIKRDPESQTKPFLEVLRWYDN